MYDIDAEIEPLVHSSDNTLYLYREFHEQRPIRARLVEWAGELDMGFLRKAMEE